MFLPVNPLIAKRARQIVSHLPPSNAVRIFILYLGSYAMVVDLYG